MRVRVLGSMKKLTSVLPRSAGTFFTSAIRYVYVVYLVRILVLLSKPFSISGRRSAHFFVLPIMATMIS